MNDGIQLFERWRAGESAAAIVLVRLHDGELAAFFRHKAPPQEGEDLKQQVWLELAKSRASEIRTSFRAYLFGIARHVLLRYCQGKAKCGQWSPLTTSLADVDPPLSQQVAERLGARDVHVALRRLPLDVQLLLEMRYLHEMSTADLANIFAVPTGTIKSRLSHARKLLEAELPGWRAKQRHGTKYD